MPEYRPVPDDREDDHGRVLSYAFNSAAGPFDPEEDVDERLRRRWSFGEDYGLFEGGELVSAITHLPFTARVRGAWLPVGGISGVATPPEHRRKGHVGRTLSATLADYRDRGWPLSALRPFEEGFYARYGWATAVYPQVATVDPAALGAVDEAATGSFRRIEATEAGDVLQPAYDAWLEGVTLATERTAEWWRDRLFVGYEHDRFCYAWDRAGEVAGYLVYDVTSEGTMQVLEFAYADDEAYLNLLRFCRDHDSQVAEVELTGFGHERLFEVVTDRDALTLRTRPGHMVRIVDVPAALEAVPFPPAVEADLVLAVTDDQADWNDGRFALSVADGAASVTATEADPDATLDMGTLSRLLVGRADLPIARATGDLAVADPGVVETLASAFPGTRTYLPERF